MLQNRLTLYLPEHRGYSIQKKVWGMKTWKIFMTDLVYLTVYNLYTYFGPFNSLFINQKLLTKKKQGKKPVSLMTFFVSRLI